MRGMWVAFALAAVLIGFIVQRVRAELEQQTERLEQTRRRQARVDKLGALATLAASATHELGTPLATIAVVARELGRALISDAALKRDAALIRAQVDRCRSILEQLSVEASTLKSGVDERTSLKALIDGAAQGFGRVDVVLATDLGRLDVVLPTKALGMALRNLLKNGIEATRGTEPVVLSVAREDGALAFRVADQGVGMDDEQLKQVAEPVFFSKGQGMGLGLFLAKPVAEQLDGSRELASGEAGGTLVTIRVPLDRFDERQERHLFEVVVGRPPPEVARRNVGGEAQVGAHQLVADRAGFGAGELDEYRVEILDH